MAKSTLISEMQKFHFGSRILCSDGEEGVLTHVGFDPTTRRITDIGVKQGRFFGKTSYVPYDTVVNATDDGVTLRIERAELEASKTAPGTVLFDTKTVVERDGASGRGTLRMIAVHPTSGELAYLVVHALRPGQDVLLRNELVTTLAPERIVVSIADAALQALPPFRPDSELQQEVESALFDLTSLHVDFRGIVVRVLDSVLYLDGNVSSSLRSDIAQDQVLGIKGLLEVKNRLVGDDTLAGDLAMALGRDPRTRDLSIGVYPRLGVVRLSGNVRTAQERSVVEEIARNFPGVQSIINDLQLNANSGPLPVMSSAETGEPEDKIPGKYIRHTK